VTGELDVEGDLTEGLRAVGQAARERGGRTGVDQILAEPDWPR
jgi:hypothetical protein